MINKNVKKFGLINTIEGYSYIILIFIAMPLKYLAGFAIATKVVGMIHGILFIAFLILLFQASKDAKWPLKMDLLFFIASLIPFGTFFTKNKIKAYE